MDWERAYRRAAIEVDELRETVRQLRERLAVPSLPNPYYPPQLKLTIIQSQMLQLLEHREIVSMPLMDQMFPSTHKGERASPKVFQVHMVRVRRAVAPYGVEIKCRQAQGYYLDGENKQRLKTALDGLWAELRGQDNAYRTDAGSFAQTEGCGTSLS